MNLSFSAHSDSRFSGINGFHCILVWASQLQIIVSWGWFKNSLGLRRVSLLLVRVRPGLRFLGLVRVIFARYLEVSIEKRLKSLFYLNRILRNFMKFE